MSWIPGDVMSVPGQLFDSERHFLKHLAIHVSDTFVDPTIVNIGIWMGASCYCMRMGAPEARLVGIDVMGTYPIEAMHPDLLGHLQMQVIKRNSNFVSWSEPIHLIFIDGGHEFEVVDGDITKFCPYVVSGGYVVFHDSRRDEVKEAIDFRFRDKAVFEDWSKGDWEELTRSGDKQVGSLAWFRRV